MHITTIERRFQVEILPDVAWRKYLRRFRHAAELGFERVATAMMPSLRIP